MATDVTRAVDLISRGCDGGDPKSCTHLGVVKLSGTVLPADPPGAALLFEASCTAGSGEACHYLGMQYLLGMGVTPNPDLARAHNLTACQRHVAAGCGALAGMIEAGLSFSTDMELAATMRGRACEWGDLYSCAMLGSMLMERVDEAGSVQRAGSLLLKACKGNKASGCIHLGDLVGAGKLTDAMGTDPVGIYSRAAELGEEGCKAGDIVGCMSQVESLFKLNRADDAGALARMLRPRLEAECQDGDVRGCLLLEDLCEETWGGIQDPAAAADARRRACAMGAKTACP